MNVLILDFAEVIMSDIQFNVSKLFGNANRFIEAYHRTLHPLCVETGIPPMALDILLFVANNPESAMANDICRCRGLKPGIVSVHVERLVNGGLLRREAVQGDRRKTRLICTDEATDLVERGREYQQIFAARLMDGLDENDIETFRRIVSRFSANIDEIRKSEGLNKEGNNA